MFSSLVGEGSVFSFLCFHQILSLNFHCATLIVVYCFCSCRLDQLPFYVAFLAPVVTIITINTGIFIVIMYKLSTRPASSAEKDNVTCVRLKRAFGILILVGLSWVLGFLAVSNARLVFHYLFAICNSLQGFAIFMFYCVTQRNVREAWVALLRCDTKSLYKSTKSLYTDSQYERRRLSSASRSMNDMGSMRVRCNTNLSNVGYNT